MKNVFSAQFNCSHRANLGIAFGFRYLLYSTFKNLKLNINQLNNGNCDKTHVNNSNNDEERETLDQDDKKSKSDEITEQINPNTRH